MIYLLHTERRNVCNMKWAKEYGKCRSCGSTERPHRARGLCTSCYWKEYNQNRYSGDLDSFIKRLTPALNKAKIGVNWDGKRLVLRQFGQILVDIEVT